MISSALPSATTVLLCTGYGGYVISTVNDEAYIGPKSTNLKGAITAVCYNDTISGNTFVAIALLSKHVHVLHLNSESTPMSPAWTEIANQ